MDTVIREFALQMLRKLQSRAPSQPRPSFKESHAECQEPLNGDINEASAEQGAHTVKDKQEDELMEDGQLPADDLVHTPYLPERIELPADKAHVLQHVELLFALSVKVPEFLDE
jgi:symplekin